MIKRLAVFGLLGLASLAAPVLAGASPTPAQCAARVNDTQAKLVDCIQQAALWGRLVDFQTIAIQNPGPDGHATRDTGAAGYLASVDYVAGLMRAAGYKVAIQPYQILGSKLAATPALSVGDRVFLPGRDFWIARLSGSGAVTAPIQPAGLQAAVAAGAEAADGCAAADFAGFVRGHVALIRRGACDYDDQVANAQASGAAGVILYNAAGEAGRTRKGGGGETTAFGVGLRAPAQVPVVGVASHAVGAELLRRWRSGSAGAVRLDVSMTKPTPITDYNVIADSPLGDPNHVVVVEGHLDSIYGAGMLDNASGSVTILEIALQLARTPTRNQLRYIWFGGEEINLLGSAYYTTALAKADLAKIVFDLDSDVTATPNYDISIADPAFAPNRRKFPANVIPASMLGTKDFINYFSSVGLTAKSASFGNQGTDSNSFSLVGVPNTGILTQQDCCKLKYEVKIWGGYRGNYEGDIPSFDGGCVDNPGLWCDNLSNNDPKVLTFVSKGVAAVVFELANDASLKPAPK